MEVAKHIVLSVCVEKGTLNLVSLFLACLQGYLFAKGPLRLEDVHHFAYQLFEAVDFLHHKLKIVHCDIKRKGGRKTV